MDDLLNMMPEFKVSKEDLEDYLILLNREYVKERARDAFRLYVVLMVSVGAAVFALVFSIGYMLPGIEVFPNILSTNANSTSAVSGDQSDTAMKFELAFILATSATAAAAITFAALGSNAIQRQTDKMSALMFAMDEIRDRIDSKKLDEAGGNSNESNNKGADGGEPGNQEKDEKNKAGKNLRLDIIPYLKKVTEVFRKIYKKIKNVFIKENVTLPSW